MHQSLSLTYLACTLLAPVVNGNVLPFLLSIADGNLTGWAADAFRSVPQLLSAVCNAGTAAVDTVEHTIALQRRRTESIMFPTLLYKRGGEGK